MREVVFIHSAGPQSEAEGSGPLLRALRAALAPEFEIAAPIMPAPDNPEARPWLAALGQHLSTRTGPYALVGHSLGGSTILQHLALHGVPAGLVGVVCVAAPFWGAGGWDFADFALAPDAGEALRELRQIVFIQSDDDEVVEAEHLELYAEVFPWARQVRLAGHGHAFERGGASEIAAEVRALRFPPPAP